MVEPNGFWNQVLVDGMQDRKAPKRRYPSQPAADHYRTVQNSKGSRILARGLARTGWR